jgi:ethanolamine utilization protein EutJ
MKTIDYDINMENVNRITRHIEEKNNSAINLKSDSQIKVGVDLGTRYTVIVVLDMNDQPITYEMKYSRSVKDGLVVDYMSAVDDVRYLKKQIEDRTGLVLEYAAAAIPPGTSANDCKTHRYVVEASGMEVTAMIDEPVAANTLLGIKNGAVVDIGGGTTGIAVFHEGKNVYSADEPTGGTHVSLVLSGNKRISFEEAEELKMNPAKYDEVLRIVKPVIEKMAAIIEKHIRGFGVDHIYLAGGTSCLTGIDKIIQNCLGIPVSKPENPLLVTPIGIAMNCLINEK